MFLHSSSASAGSSSQPAARTSRSKHCSSPSAVARVCFAAASSRACSLSRRNADASRIAAQPWVPGYCRTWNCKASQTAEKTKPSA